MCIWLMTEVELCESRVFTTKLFSTFSGFDLRVVTSNPMHGKVRKTQVAQPDSEGMAMATTKSLTTSYTMMPFVKLQRRRSWPDSDWHGMAPKGYLSVYVGPDRTRFVIKTESVNDPLFRMLIEDAEKEYGFDLAGPLTLPCEVSVFCRILYTMNTVHEFGDSLDWEDACLGLLSGVALDFLN